MDGAINAFLVSRQIDKLWSTKTYNKGGLMEGIEHVVYRHGLGSGQRYANGLRPGTSK